MIKKITFTFSFLILILNVSAQVKNDYLELVQYKFLNEYKKDNNYLNVHYIEFKDTLPGIKFLPREDGSKLYFKKAKDTVKTYLVFYIKNGVGLETISPFLISMFSTYKAPTTGGGKSLIDKKSTSQAAKVDTYLVYYANDFANLKFSTLKENEILYKKFIDYLQEQISPTKVLKKSRNLSKEKQLLNLPISYSDNRMFQAYVSPDNTDFLNNLITNGYHKLISYDKIIDQTEKQEENQQIDSTQIKTEQWYNFFDIVYSDISFSKQTICINGISNFFSLGIAKVGFENSFEDRALNLLPLEAPYHNFGLNVFFNLSGNLEDVQNSFFGNIRLLIRNKYHSSHNFNWLPLFEVKEPKLNVNSGFTIEGELSKGIFSSVMKNLPVFTFYYSIGGSKLPKPYYNIYDTASIFPKYYYSRTQWEYGMSFFWNTDKKSHYRLDLGVGGYDIHKFEYFLDTTDTPVILSNSSVKNYVQPYISLTYDAIPNKAILGYKIKFYDSRFSFKIWTRLFEILKSDVRLEAYIISKPIMRNNFNWENNGGSFVQLRYRYAF
ncbi:MAG TPA: hypothetical protein PK887_09245 [Ignavibacteriales bacterium]|nr:hypothetical protein [Ignavibacteriales bacterium]